MLEDTFLSELTLGHSYEIRFKPPPHPSTGFDRLSQKPNDDARGTNKPNVSLIIAIIIIAIITIIAAVDRISSAA